MATLLLWLSMAQAQVAGQVPQSPALLGRAAPIPHKAYKTQATQQSCVLSAKLSLPAEWSIYCRQASGSATKGTAFWSPSCDHACNNMLCGAKPACADFVKCTLYSYRSNSHSKPPMRRAPAPPPYLSANTPAAAIAAENGPPAVEAGPTAAAACAGRSTTEAEASVSGRDAAMTASASSAMQEGAANRSKDVAKTDAQGKVVMGPPPAKTRSGSVTKHPFLAAKCLG